MAQKLELLATHKIPDNEDLYTLIDFLNRTLKDKNLIFGVSQRDGQMIVSVYET